MSNSGVIAGVFSEQELLDFRDNLFAYDVIESRGNLCYGVDYKHPYYNEFMRKYFSKIREALGDYDMLPIFAMYLVENKPWTIHTDDYHQLPTAGSRHLSILSPMSVDFNPSLVSESETIVFNEKSNLEHKADWIQTATVKENSVEYLWDDYLSHNPKYINGVYQPDKYTLDGMYTWKIGDLIWWNSEQYHDTSNFLAKGYTSKQALVTHTYKEK